MSGRKRTVIALIVIELLRAGAWIWFHNLATTSANARPEAPAVIGPVFGAAMA